MVDGRQWPAQVMAGKGLVTAWPMLDSSKLLADEDWVQLQSKLQQDGYLLIRGALDRASVQEACGQVVAKLRAWKPEQFAGGSSQLKLTDGAGKIGLLQRQDIASSLEVRRVLESSDLFRLMRGLMQVEQVATTGYKWLRAVAKGEFTGLHCDKVFLGRGSQRLLTAWLPLSQVAVEDGSMLVCAGSHRMRSFAKLRDSYGGSQVGQDGTVSGWLTDNGQHLSKMVSAQAISWHTADFQPGDVVVLHLGIFHMSAANVSNTLRISCDTRWQPAQDERDPRLHEWRDQMFE